MRFIPGGALVAGTPPGSLPRIADEEMPGEQVVLKGFYIDVFPYPNEEGAIALTSVDQAGAAALCEQAGKRLCSELEWERACKGPNNYLYEYGDEYRADRCRTGVVPRLRPSGILVGCVSDFGVRDMHGAAWEWTSSPWGRGDSRDLASVRGGNAKAGELVARCANASARRASVKSNTLGFRCCAGPRNQAEVTLKVTRAKRLSSREVDPQLARQIVSIMPEAAKQDLGDSERFQANRMWVWHPVGNEELFAMGGCVHVTQRPRCGVFLARQALDRTAVIAWASSGSWTPSLHIDQNPKDLWLLGGDAPGSFRVLIEYVYGRVEVRERERRIPVAWTKKALRSRARAQARSQKAAKSKAAHKAKSSR